MGSVMQMWERFGNPQTAQDPLQCYQSTSRNINLVELIDITGTMEEEVLWWQYYINMVGSDRLLMASTFTHEFLVNCCSIEV